MTKYVGNEPGLLAYYSLLKETNNLYMIPTSDNTAIVLNADTNGLGEGKFLNTRFFTKLELKDQLSSSYDALKPILYC
jgi:hypothetical protein